MEDLRPDPATPTMTRLARVRVWLLAAIAVVVVGWALKAAGAVAVPIVFAIFLCLVVAPIDRHVAERVGKRWRWLGHVSAMAAILAAIMAFFAGLWLAARQVVARFPDSGSGLAGMLPIVGAEGTPEPAGSAAPGAPADEGAQGGGGAGPEQLLDVLRDAGGNFAGTLSSWASALAQQIVTTAGTLIATAVVVFFLTLLMLIEAPRWRSKLATLLRPNAEGEALEAVATIASRLRGYLLARTLLGALTGALYAGWLWFFDVDLLLVWALIALLLNFIPTLGSVIAGLLPVLYVFLQRDIGTAVAVAAGILVIEQVMGNFVDPRVQGHQIALSPLVILLALLIWSWIWGVAGAVLAVPITVAVLVTAAHLPPLRPLALLLSNQEDMAGLDRSLAPKE